MGIADVTGHARGVANRSATSIATRLARFASDFLLSRSPLAFDLRGKDSGVGVGGLLMRHDRG